MVGIMAFLLINTLGITIQKQECQWVDVSQTGFLSKIECSTDAQCYRLIHSQTMGCLTLSIAKSPQLPTWFYNPIGFLSKDAPLIIPEMFNHLFRN